MILIFVLSAEARILARSLRKNDLLLSHRLCTGYQYLTQAKKIFEPFQWLIMLTFTRRGKGIYNFYGMRL